MTDSTPDAASLAATVELQRRRIEELENELESRKRFRGTTGESAESLRAVFTSMMEMVVFHELLFDDAGNPIDYRIVDCNKAFTSITGIDRDAAIGRTSMEVYRTIEPPYFQEYSRVALTGNPHFFEAYFPPMDKHFSISVVSSGKNRFATISIDTTNQKRIEEALLHSEEKLSNALSIAKLGPWELDVGSGMFTFNDAFYELFRTSAEEQGGYLMSIADYATRFVHPDDASQVAEETRKALETEDPGFNRYVEHRIRYANGTIGHIGVRFFIIKDSSGKTVKTYGVNQDITERKKEEQERAKLNEQLIHARKMESVGRLAGGVAHDFNNMLGVMLGNTEIALDCVDPTGPVAVCLEEIRTAAEHSADLTRQLLAFARRQTIVPRVLDLNETVSGMLKMLRRLVGENIDIVWNPGESIGPLHMDPTQLHQILANLTVNARDAIADVGRITISTSQCRIDETYTAEHFDAVSGEYAVLTVVDDGCGMDQATVANLFEPFFTTKELGRGTGLGLSTVHGIVKQNNGYVDVLSVKGHGATFRILFPIFSRPTKEPVVSQTPVEIRGSETILLVEDEPAVLRLGKRMLEGLGYQVITAALPSEAVALAKQHGASIQLLITDIVMPEMNGRELARHILSIHPNIRCLFMSGYTADVIAHRGVLNEGVRFLQKPFTREELSTVVRKVLKD
jgi:PAS domain S-box-containing protein